MSIQDELERLMTDAKQDKSLRNKLVSAGRTDDPMNSFCDVCLSNGYEIYLGELFAYGQDMNDSKLRSVNGGGVNAIDGWDDTFGMLIKELEEMED
ncbi:MULTISPECIES: hypothetical protein [unclassified Ruminococcus]|uniref:hypothetical protein n=1 Tax=unclassified Ruminococcus TaxID=2608920 RepID=UPI0021095A0A|nr:MULTISPECIES: hypothetical protein [unclassified Ruminococcus]MCQ4023044.1 hypothetical protein [Ruminococcus sp. zg-924]MCQ4115481.1 hypothetical protein [Ruminococcus sp. zg-921]